MKSSVTDTGGSVTAERQLIELSKSKSWRKQNVSVQRIDRNKLGKRKDQEEEEQDMFPARTQNTWWPRQAEIGEARPGREQSRRRWS